MATIDDSSTLTKMLENKTAIATGDIVRTADEPPRTFQASVDGTGAVTASIDIFGSNDGTHFVWLATITLSGTTTASDAVYAPAPYTYFRADLTAISGTNANVNVLMKD